MGSRSRHGSGASSTGERGEPPDLPPTMSYTLDVILKRLHEKRREMHRPEDIEVHCHLWHCSFCLPSSLVLMMVNDHFHSVCELVYKPEARVE